MDIKNTSSLPISFLSTPKSHSTHNSGLNIARNSESVAVPSQASRQSTVNESQELSFRRVEQTEKLEQQRTLAHEQLVSVVERLEEFIATFNTNLSFRIDDESGRNVVTVYEKSSGNVIRQIPNEEMLELSRQMAEYHGGLVSTKV
ncbi:flagellar protein FlaG [Thaumasiovibrio sp. DFM-14]|uniref:flagellar protein FlaG n=1 Tax=Thaumasiovibrio sp. DFM-14 TaxID=3384792 RepID=UPI0039A3E88B